MTIGIYERVSKRGQKLDSQHTDLSAFALGQEAQGQTVRWFSDHFTGRTLNRPAMTKLMNEINAGRIKTLVTWRLDRLGRTARGLAALFEQLASLKVNFISMREGIDLSTPSGRLVAHVMASVAEYESEVRAERIAAGKEAKAMRIAAIIKNGGTAPAENKGGRPKGTPSKVTKTMAGMIADMKSKGCKIASIARELHLSRQTVYAVLNNGR